MSLPGTANRVSPEEEIQTVHSASGGGESNEAATRLAETRSGSVSFKPSHDTGLESQGLASSSSLHENESAKYVSMSRPQEAALRLSGVALHRRTDADASPRHASSSEENP
jgi:hypothetical protein